MNPEVRMHSGTVPGTIRNTNVENDEPIEDSFLDDPHRGMGPSVCQSGHSIDSDPGEAPHMVTAVQEEMPYCSSETCSGKQNEAHSTSWPQLSSENTAATSDTDQTLLEFQQLASKSNSANFTNKINRVFKLPKVLTTTMPTSDGK